MLNAFAMSAMPRMRRVRHAIAVVPILEPPTLAFGLAEPSMTFVASKNRSFRISTSVGVRYFGDVKGVPTQRLKSLSE